MKLEKRVIYYEEIDSTNNEAKRLASTELCDGVIVADKQTAGRGRMGRGWSSPAGMGIWMSILLRPKMSPDKAPMMTLLGAMAVSDVLGNLGVPCQIKWPNDIIIENKKVCGILTEMGTIGQAIDYVVVGIGINVHNDSFPKDIEGIATSLKIACPACAFSREQIIEDVLERFEYYYDTFMKNESLLFIKGDYNKRLVNVNKDVYIMEQNNRQQGHCLGIDDEGALVVVVNGKEEHIHSGEVSVRGVYGYV